jgi:hypothetical protein
MLAKMCNRLRSEPASGPGNQVHQRIKQLHCLPAELRTPRYRVHGPCAAPVLALGAQDEGGVSGGRFNEHRWPLASPWGTAGSGRLEGRGACSVAGPKPARSTSSAKPYFPVSRISPASVYEQFFHNPNRQMGLDAGSSRSGQRVVCVSRALALRLHPCRGQKQPMR